MTAELNLRPAFEAVSKASRAAAMPSTDRAWAPSEVNCRSRIRRLTGWGSTIRVRPCASADRDALKRQRSTASVSIPSGTRNQKRLPSPGSLSTPISPFISSISSLQMARPSPDPPCRRVVELSSREKR